MRLIFRNLPLADVHPHAEAAAEIAEAVGLQGKFWEIHDALFQNQKDLSDAALLRYVTDVGGDVDRATKDIADGGPRQRVEADFEGAIRSGANGTPTFFVNGVRFDGSWLYEPFSEFLANLLDG
jgi:protein-disulfide isomerase